MSLLSQGLKTFSSLKKNNKKKTWKRLKRPREGSARPSIFWYDSDKICRQFLTWYYSYQPFNTFLCHLRIVTFITHCHVCQNLFSLKEISLSRLVFCDLGADHYSSDFHSFFVLSVLLISRRRVSKILTEIPCPQIINDHPLRIEISNVFLTKCRRRGRMIWICKIDFINVIFFSLQANKGRLLYCM